MDVRFLVLTGTVALIAFEVTWMAGGSSPAVYAGTSSPIVSDSASSPAVAAGASIAAGPDAVYYSGCNAVRAAGAAPLLRGEPGYREDMDGDRDGIACEPHRGG